MMWLQVHELEGELEGEVRRSAEAQRGARRLERCVKELTYQVFWLTPTVCFPGLHPAEMYSVWHAVTFPEPCIILFSVADTAKVLVLTVV